MRTKSEAVPTGVLYARRRAGIALDIERSAEGILEVS